jgi:hypothetical protein
MLETNSWMSHGVIMVILPGLTTAPPAFSSPKWCMGIFGANPSTSKLLEQVLMIYSLSIFQLRMAVRHDRNQTQPSSPKSIFWGHFLNPFFSFGSFSIKTKV